MLVLSSQAPLLGGNPVFWLTDQEQVCSFQKGPLPEKAKLRRWWTTAPGTGITGPYTPSYAARVHRHSPPPCAGRHKHAAWSVTPTTREHHQTSPSSNSSMTSGPRKGNSPPCYAPHTGGTRPGRPPPCAPPHPPPPTPGMARPPHSGSSPGTRKIRQKRHAVQVPTVRQPHPGGHGAPYHPRGTHPRRRPHQ